MLDALLFREIATLTRAARERISVALSSGDTAELYCAEGLAAASVTAAIKAETHLAIAAGLLDRAARLAPATEPVLLAELIDAGVRA